MDNLDELTSPAWGGLHLFDWIVIVAYVVTTLTIGLWLAKKAAGGIDDYYLGGRRLPWYLLGMSGMTQWFDTTGTLIITAFLFMLGPQGLFVEFRGGAVLALAFMLVFSGKWHRRSGCVTAAEWQIFRFGKGKDAEWARLLTAFTGIIGTIGMMAYLVKGTQIFMGMYLPYSPTLMTLLLVGVATIYTMISGFYGVVATDFIQGVIILIAAIVVGVMAWLVVDSPAALAVAAEQVTGNPNWLDSAPAWKVDLPAPYDAYNHLFIFMMFYLIRNTLGGLGAGAEPRFFGARNDRECGLQSLLQGCIIAVRWPMMIGMAVLGIFLVVREMPDQTVALEAATMVREQFPDVREAQWVEATSRLSNHPAGAPVELQQNLLASLGEQWPDKLRMVSYHGAVNPELIVPAVLKTEMPIGIHGLLLVWILAAMMSTFDSSMNRGSAFFVRDIYQRWIRPKASGKECVRVSYFVVLGFALSALWMGLLADNINEIWGWLVMGLGAGVIAPTALRMIWWRLNGWGVAASLLCGTAAAISQRALAPGMTEWRQFTLMSLVSFGAAITVSLLTAPTNKETLLHFYRRTRPFGWWAPVKENLPEEERLDIRRENRTDIAAVPFVMLAQVTLFLLGMQLVIHNYAAFAKTLPLFIIGLLGGWWFWWRPLRWLDQADKDVS